MPFTLSDDYLYGFTEGQGSFYVGVVPSKETTSGWQVMYLFKVSQNPSGKVVLDYFKKRLRCGYVKPNHRGNTSRDKSLAFVVRDFPSIQEKVIPFFDNKLVMKKKDFEKFKKVIDIVAHKGHLTKKGITEIIDLAYSMNSGKRKVSREQILRSYKD